MKTVAVLYGGKSGEHEVSLISAASIIAHLDKTKYSIVPIGITKEGEWYLQTLPQWAYTPPEQGLMRALPEIEKTSRVIAVPGRGLWLETEKRSSKPRDRHCISSIARDIR